MPGIKVISRSLAVFKASSIPETVSWSVSAKYFTLAALALLTTSEGEDVPSEAVECVCKSHIVISVKFSFQLIVFIKQEHMI